MDGLTKNFETISSKDSGTRIAKQSIDTHEISKMIIVIARKKVLRSTS
tara:strand:+ start:1167 stop:1310 length:144 start_codon:yes stop_codon:yes gene_type:complete